jgi:serine/threonine-protein kinase
VTATTERATLTARGDAAAKVAPAADAAPRDSVEAPELPAEIFARYESIELLGRGGMGVVYRARDRRLDREVAIKLLFEDNGDEGLALLAEARSQARLDHEHACKVYEVGVADGKPYLVMQLIDGVPLDRAKWTTLREKVTIVRQVALALHQAHRFGLLHRDVKPSNILVECVEGGACKPYLMDFGIAREIGQRGKTLTGAIEGTPAFMAPEQARGEVQALDGRTDVYGLGATLYDLLAGRPPFAAPSPRQILRQIMTAEAPPIRTLNRAVPEDLEAIVARCLEKEPRRRYDSAKALADDLQRFLDGETVHARRPSLGYVLLRKARKHRVRVALSGAAFVIALVVAALGLRARRLAEERAHLARELGEDVKEMQLFLRSAYGLPLHDTEREKDIVRDRLRTIETRMTAAGPAGDGPGHYALGRGYLALHEPEEALWHLERARSAGYTSPEVDYALGLSLGELFTKARDAAKRIENPAHRSAREAAIEARYGEPARRHLRASLGARLETAAYAEGLLLLHEGRPELAIAKAAEAFANMPWLYEAKILEGDAHFAIGSRFRHDGAFDYEKMNDAFRKAAESYRNAAEIGRSDPRVHLAECELWAQTMNAATVRAESLKPSFEKAKAACSRAIAASSKRDEGRLELAFVQVSYAWWLATGAVGEDPTAIVEDAIAQATDAMRRSPRNPMAPYVVGEAWRAKAQYLNDRGLESRASIDRAIPSFEEAIRLDPTFLWAIHALSNTYALRAVNENFHGVDPSPSLESSMRYCSRGTELDPSHLPSRSSAIIAHLLTAEHLVDTGRDPERPLSLARTGIQAAAELSRDWPAADYFLSYIQWLEAEHALDTGSDPTASIDRGLGIAREQVRRSPSSPEAHEALGKLAATSARHRLLRGDDPGPALREARRSFQRAAEARPWDLSFPIWRARVDAIDLRWAAKKHTVDAAAFRAALAPLVLLLAQAERVDPRPYRVMAEIHAIEAAWRMERGRTAPTRPPAQNGSQSVLRPRP